VVYFQQPCFEAVSELAVDFFAVKVEAAVIELIHVIGFLSEHVEKLQRLQQVTEFGAFLWSTPQHLTPADKGAGAEYQIFCRVCCFWV